MTIIRVRMASFVWIVDELTIITVERSYLL